MKLRRVKITGIGPVTPAGIGREAFWKGILEPVSRVGIIDRFAAEAGPFVGAEVKGFELSDYISSISPKRMPRHTQFAVAAAALAAKDAGLQLEDLGHVSTVVSVGASLMDFGTINKTVEMIVKKGPIQGVPSSVFSASVSAIGGTIAGLMGNSSRTIAIQSACCAGLDAIGYGANLVAQGEAELAICGGTEAPLFFHPMLELKMVELAPRNEAHPEKQCRPFDLWRTTGVIGEGACVLILEPESSPRPAHAWINGYSFVTDTAGEAGNGLFESMKMAIANAGMRPFDIECINAWGPGHRVIDRAEARAIGRLFGEGAREVAAVSIKGSIGNPLGAAGAIQTACAALSQKHGVIPPTVNWERPDPACPLNLANVARIAAHDITVVNSHGLSGTNACLVVKRT